MASNTWVDSVDQLFHQAVSVILDKSTLKLLPEHIWLSEMLTDGLGLLVFLTKLRLKYKFDYNMMDFFLSFFLFETEDTPH